MSQENIEGIKRAYEAMSELDAEAVVALCEPDVEFRSRIAEADDVTYRGHDGVRDYIARLKLASDDAGYRRISGDLGSGSALLPNEVGP